MSPEDFPLICGSQSAVPKQAAVVSPGNLLEMPGLGHHPRPAESNSGRVVG